MSDRHVVVKVALGNLTRSGQLYVATVAGREVYKGRSPYFDGARALVDDHGYQLDDLISHIWPDGTRSQPVTLNTLYWTQNAVSWVNGVRQDARDGAEGTGAAADTISSVGGAGAE